MKIKRTQSTLSKLVWAVVYATVSFALCISACFIFQKNYYDSIFVTGSSMEPTLLGAKSSSINDDRSLCEFGLIDTNKTTINSLERFDIVTTLFPWDSGDYAQPYNYDNPSDNTPLKTASYKIKRIIALPGETFKIDNNELYVLNNNTGIMDHIPMDFMSHITQENLMNQAETTLADDEYWVLGDNWGRSSDSSTHKKPVRYENITGVLIMIQGTCRYQYIDGKDHCVDKKYYSTPRMFKNV